MHISNPVIPGFYPDPSVCRVGNTYYLVTSSFSYFPGIPLFESTDLSNWTQIGHVLTQENSMDFSGLALSDGVWAPTIRHINNTFFCVYSVSHGPDGMKTYVVTAQDPQGPWSQPKQLDVEGFDPSLFQDDDGRVWLTACKDRFPRVQGSPGCLWLREFDPETCTVISPEIDLWAGALRNAWVEAPRLFKRDGRYWLVAAEGGTERGHAVTVAHSDNVEGPYIGDGRNPLLTHRNLHPDWSVQNVGHADLVDDQAGNTWAVALGVRPIRGHHTIGRETFLVPVDWTSQGPVFAPSTGRVELEFEADIDVSEDAEQLRTAAESTDTNQYAWITPFKEVNYTVSENGLTIIGQTLEPIGPVSCSVMRRQTAQAFQFDATLTAQENAEKVSTFIMQNPERYIEVSLGRQGLETALSLRTGRGNHTETQVLSLEAPAHRQHVRFVCQAPDYDYEVLIGEPDKMTSRLKIDREFFSTESAGGFVGTVLGVSCVPTLEGAAIEFADVNYQNLV